MKKTIFFIVVEFISLFVKSQVAIVPNLVKNYGGSSYDLPADIIVDANDSTYVLIGRSMSQDYDVSNPISNLPFWWIVKVDTLGNIIWDRSFGVNQTTVEYFPMRGILTSDGNYLIVGTIGGDSVTYVNYHDDLDALLICLSPNGDTLWTHCYGGSWYDYGMDVKEDSAGNFVVAGITMSQDGDIDSTNNNSNDAWIFKVDHTGNLIWSKVFGGPDYDGIYSLDIDSANNIVFVGRTENFPGYLGGSSDILGGKLTQDGDSIWIKLFGGDGGDWGERIKALPDGGYVFTGFYYLPNNSANATNVIIYKIDDSGNVVWNNEWGGMGKQDMGYDIYLSDTSIFIGGEYRKYYEHPQIGVWEFDFNGNLINALDWGIVDNDETTRNLVYSTFENKFLTLASIDDEVLDSTMYNNYGATDYQLLKFEIKDTSTYTYSNVNYTGSNIMIYPNPVKDNLTLQHAKNISVKIFDITGKCVMERKIENDNVELNLKNVENGLYFLKIYSKDFNNIQTIKLIINK